MAALDNLLRLKPRDKDLVRELFALLCQLDLAATWDRLSEVYFSGCRP